MNHATDSGRSCPTPFDGYFLHGPDHHNMTEITVGDSYENFQREVDEFPAPQDERAALLTAVREAL